MLKRTDNGEPMSVDADEVIAATGFTCPLQDLTELGVTTFGQAKLPSVTPLWESATVPGIFFAGTISSASPGLKKHGIPSYSGRRAGPPVQRPGPRPPHRGEPVRRVDRPTAGRGRATSCRTCCARRPARPSCGTRRPTSARVLSVSADDGIRDEGILPVVHALDGMTEDVIAMTVEADGTGAIYPVVYVRREGRLEEHALPAPSRCSTSRPAAHADALQAAIGGSGRARSRPPDGHVGRLTRLDGSRSGYFGTV